jgi:hypothetical protein
MKQLYTILQVNHLCTLLDSLDASKAFDKLWRAGLFFKMIGKLDPPLWRILYNYYSISKIIVRFNNEKSGVIKISEGVKQGGILSPFLCCMPDATNETKTNFITLFHSVRFIISYFYISIPIFLV